MALAFADLLVGLSSEKEKVPPEEDSVITRCSSETFSELIGGALFGGCSGLAATWKIGKFVQLCVSGGAAAFFGARRFRRSLESSVDHILDLDGSHIQRELANIIVTKHQNDPWLMKHMHRHFYLEKVFDGSSYKPILRWCYRNFPGDNVAHDQRTNDSSTQSGSDNVSQNNPDSAKPHVESKQVSIKSGTDVMEDPLDSIFGWMAPVEEIIILAPQTHLPEHLLVVTEDPTIGVECSIVNP